MCLVQLMPLYIVSMMIFRRYADGHFFVRGQSFCRNLSAHNVTFSVAFYNFPSSYNSLQMLLCHDTVFSNADPFPNAHRGQWILTSGPNSGCPGDSIFWRESDLTTKSQQSGVGTGYIAECSHQIYDNLTGLAGRGWGTRLPELDLDPINDSWP